MNETIAYGRRKWLTGFCYIQLMASILLMSLAVAPAAAKNCEQTWSQNRYYIIDPEQMLKVSGYFRNRLDYTIELKSGMKTHLEQQQIERVYFDTADLDLFTKHISLSIQTLRHLSKFNEQRRKVVLNISKKLQPPEYFKYQTRNYKRKLNPVEQHPLLGTVKRTERADLINRLAHFNVVTVTGLTPSLRVVHEDISFSLRKFNIPYLQVNLGQATISAKEVSTVLSSINFELLPHVETGLDAHVRKELEQALAQVHCEFRKAFPELQPVSEIGYQHYYQAALDKFPGLSWFRKFPIAFKIIQALLLALVGILLLFLVINRQQSNIKIKGYRLSSKFTESHDDRS